MAKKKVQRLEETTKVPSQLEKDVGARVKAIRVANGLTQEQLAEALGKSVQTIHNYEKGITRLPYEVMIALNEKYHASIDELLLGNNASLELMFEKDIRNFSDMRLDTYMRLISKEVSRRLLEKNK